MNPNENPSGPSINSGTEQTVGGQGKNIAMAVIAYILFFIPLLTSAKNDPFVKYHVKQGLVLFLAGVVTAVVGMVPVVGMFSWILTLGMWVLFIIGIINSVKGLEKPLPLIGHFADNFKF